MINKDRARLIPVIDFAGTLPNLRGDEPFVYLFVMQHRVHDQGMAQGAWIAGDHVR
jgi:hypothetical protein